MAVYVDDVAHPFKHMIMCHMWADSLEELLAMATLLGIQHKWLQKPPKASWVHFDVALGKKKLAIQKGAILTDMLGPHRFLAARGDTRSIRVMESYNRIKGIKSDLPKETF